MPCPMKVQKKYTKRKDRNRQETKTFLPYFPLFTWWMGEPTLRPKTQRGAPKHQIVKLVLSVRRHYPKRGRFTENLSIYLSSPAPISLLQNPSNFGATRFPLATLLFIIFLFSDFKPDGCVEPYAWRRVYTFCIWQPTSQYPVGSFIVNS